MIKVCFMKSLFKVCFMKERKKQIFLYLHIIFIPFLQMRISPKGGFVRFCSLLVTNLSPKYGIHTNHKISIFCYSCPAEYWTTLNILQTYWLLYRNCRDDTCRGSHTLLLSPVTCSEDLSFVQAASDSSRTLKAQWGGLRGVG